jgi:hypothetical protein
MERALQSLEKALTSPAPKRERVWKQATRRSLATIVGLVQEHCAWAERSNGFLDEIEDLIGRNRDLSHVRREHGRLQREAVDLLAGLDEYEDPRTLPYHDIRKRSLQLAVDLRLHQAREADLLMLAFQLDIGGEG